MLSGMSRKLKDLGELGMLGELLPLLRRHTSGLLLGTGDDVAVSDHAGAERLAWTIDSMIEGTHFRWWPDALATPAALGYKLVATNVSDLASKGARPLYALLSLGVPGEESMERVSDFFAGMDEALVQYGGRLIGGDTVRAPQWCLTLSLAGRLPGGAIIPARHRVKAGQMVYLSGHAGDSAAGLEVLEGRLDVPAPHRGALINAHLRPEVALELGEALAAGHGDLAMIDVSDGVVKDAGEIARASGHRIDIYTETLVPSPALLAATGGNPDRWRRYFLHGGEDYRLLFCTATEPDAVLAGRFGIRAIGKVVKGSGVHLIDGAGREMPALGGGFEHFR